jgi:hypothetical protein
MFQTIFNFLVLLAIGILVVFAFSTYLHFSLKKQNKQSREEAMKVQTDEPSE